MIKIWGRQSSLNVQKLVWLCQELQLDHETVDAGGAFGKLDTPEYLALNPNGLIPVVEVDGQVIWESNAILRYLAERAGDPSFWPDSAAARAQDGMWQDWQLTTLWPPVRTMFLQLIRTAPDKRNASLLETSIAQATQAMTVLDGALADRDYLCGQAPGLADIAVGVVAYRWFELPFDRAPFANAEAWYARLCDRPSFQQVVMHPLA